MEPNSPNLYEMLPGIKGEHYLTNILDQFKKILVCLIYSIPEKVGVYKLSCDGNEYVLKTVDVLKSNSKKQDSLDHEFNIAHKMGKECEHIMKAYNMMKIDKSETIIRYEFLFEYAGESLDKLYETASPEEIKMWLMQSLIAIQYLEARRVTHFDIKPKNIAFKDGLIKIIDMGCSIDFTLMDDVFDLIGKNANKIVGFTFSYSPPELLPGNIFKEKLSGHAFDVFCFGMTFFQIIAKASDDYMQFLMNIRKVKSEKEYERFLHIIDDNPNLIKFDPSKDTTNAILKCLKFDPMTRCTFSEIQKMLYKFKANTYRDDADFVYCYINLGIAYNNKVGDPFVAESFLQNAVMISEKRFGLNDEVTASVKGNIGNVYKKMTDYKKAMDYYTSALNIYLNSFGEFDTRTAGEYRHIALIFKEQHQYNEALKYYEKSQHIFIGLLGKENKTIMINYHNIGTIYSILGNFEKEIECYNEALHICMKIGKESTLNAAFLYKDIGTYYENIGNYKEALHFHKKSIDIFIKKLGEDNPETAELYRALGRDYLDLRDYKEARECYEKALKREKALFGEDNENVAEVYLQIGTLENSMGNYKKALENEFKSLEINKRLYGEKFKRAPNVYHNIGNVYENLGNYEKAMEYHKKSLEISEIFLGKDNIDAGDAYWGIGNTYKLRGNLDFAISNYEKALAIFQRFYDKNDYRIKALHVILGMLHATKKIMGNLLII